jgi:hypothetical protein
MDQAASEEGEKYLKVFLHQANLKAIVVKTAGLMGTDGRVGLLTYTMADQTQWGTELPNRKEAVYGESGSEGVTPETESDEEQMGSAEPSDTDGGDGENDEGEQPARREVVYAGGKLEWKVPLLADEEEEMGWARCSHEVSRNMLRAMGEEEYRLRVQFEHRSDRSSR